MNNKTSHTRTAGAKAAQNDPAGPQGFPGYRTRPSRSGLDPMDTRAEAAHNTGALVQRLLTGRLVVTNPLYLALLGLLGLGLIAPLCLAGIEAAGGSGFPAGAAIPFGAMGVIGLLALWNFARNLARMRRG